MTPPADVLVGRTWELAEVGHALTAARDGRGQLVLITGEPGIGKSRLLREAVTQAQAAGMRTVTASCWEGSDAPPYWPWMQVVRAFSADAGAYADALDVDRRALAVLVPELSAEPPLDCTSDEGSVRARLFDAVAGLLAAVAASGGLLVAIEDLHWADEASLQLVRHVASGLAHRPVLVAATLRDAEVVDDRRRAPVLAALSRSGRTVTLRGLPAGDLAALVSAVAPEELPEGWVGALAASTGGNPYFALELVRLHAASSALSTNPLGAIPRSVIDVIERRVARLPQPVVEVLQLAAVAGDRFTLAELRAAGADEGSVAEAIDLAAAAGLVVEHADGLGFCHALARHALYEHLGPATRARLHLRLGEALEAATTTPAEVLARHFLAAAPLAGSARGVRYAVAAGEHALSRFAHEDAIVWFDRALATGTDTGATADGASARIGRAEARRRSGLLAAARVDLDDAESDARALDDPVLLARAAPGTQRLGWRSGYVAHDPISRLEEAARILPATAAHVNLRAQLLAALASDLYDHALDRWDDALAHSAEGDEARLDKAERERDALLDELRRSFDLRGRPRRLGDDAERARKAVSARIRDAIARIDSSHPALGDHLRQSVQTGTWCAYRPPSATSWQVEH